MKLLRCLIAADGPDKRLRATPEQLCDALGACTELNVVYRRYNRPVMLDIADDDIPVLIRALEN